MARVRLDLGIRTLLPVWRGLFSREYLREDLLAGLTVACVAIPLSLAIALASGVSPALGLFTAILAGVVCALFGGTPLSVSGPAAAMTVLVASVVEAHGLGGLLIVGIGGGLLQLATGVFGFGKMVRYMPVPVVAGFTAGIGAIIFIGQLPRALGLPPPDQSHVINVLSHLRDEIHQAHPFAVALACSAVVICLFLPRLIPRLPASLVAVVLPTAVAMLLHLDVPTIGQMPRTLPTPALPVLPGAGRLLGLIGPTLMVFALASLETLLSSTAIDKMQGGVRHDSDQELIGQGLGNITTALFGGIPVTGVIARSALNVQLGAKTRRAAIFHSIALMMMTLLFAPVMERIPLAALGGVLLAVAIRMMNLSELWALFRASRTEGVVYLVTFGVIVFFDLVAGVQVGLLCAFLIVAVRMAKTAVALEPGGAVAADRVRLVGPLTFLSTSALDPLRQALESQQVAPRLIIDLRLMTVLDVSGAEILAELIAQLERRSGQAALIGVRPALDTIMRGSDPDGHLRSLVAASEREAEERLARPQDLEARPIARLVRGVERFSHTAPYAELFEQLADSQSPHTLFITCSDSRIVPSLITSTEPGELFVVRNVGNMIPAFESERPPSEGAGIEYAVAILGVREIVICGHSGCGAMKALLASDLPDVKELPSLRRWLGQARSVKWLGEHPSPESAAQLNTLLQLEHLTTYPCVRQRIADGSLRLHAWYYDIGRSELYAWDDEEGGYGRLADERARRLLSAEPDPGHKIDS